jgi:photosystem II stability/assembly factor-like uncharacterized protein
LASTLAGIYRTTDAGTSWTLVDVFMNHWIDMEFKPGDHNIIYASSSGYASSYLNISTDNGVTWSFSAIVTGGYRAEIAVTPNDPTVVYMLSCTNTGGLLGIHKSTNSGANFSQVNTNTTQNMLGYFCDGSGATSGQGIYDLCIAVSPTDVNTVYIGGINTWKSTDGGNTWNLNNMWVNSPTYNCVGVPVAHADKHTLVFQNGTNLFEGNDGGVYKTTNGGTNWTDLSNGLVISQIYRIGASQTSPNTILTGLQDNGTKMYNTGFWNDVKGGDGMECIVDYSNSDYMYASYVRGQISRSTTGGSDFFPTNISANIPGGQPTGAWVTPYIIDPTNSQTLYAGYDRVWKTTNRGNSWSTASQVLSASNKLRSLAIAPSNINVLYTADLNNMWRTTDGGLTNWTSITPPVTSNSLTYIAVKNNDPNTVWVTFGGYSDGEKVYLSIDGGANWTNISAGLPNIPIMCIVQYNSATDRNVLFVGTDVGVYVKNGTNNWESFNTGLPNVVVSELEILYTAGTDKLRAGTYGRGLWETNIDAALPVEISSFSASVIDSSISLNWQTAIEVNNYGFEIERSVISKEERNLSWEKIGFVNGNGNSNSPKSYSFVDDKVTAGKYSYRLKQIDNDGQFEYSKTVEVDFGTPDKFELSQNYPNPFNPTTTIQYILPQAGMVKLTLYNILGQEIRTVVNEMKEAGTHTINIDASDLNSGMYIYKIESGSFVQTKKMTLVK